MIKGNDLITREGVGQHLQEVFDFRSFGILPEELCEDRSLHVCQPKSKSYEGDSPEGLRIGKERKGKLTKDPK